MTYATIHDLEARWRPLTAAERVRADALLADAAVRIDAYAPPPTELTDAQAAAREIISCEMVKRAMAGSAIPGITQESETRGPFTAQVTYANPLGDLYLTKADRQMLRGGRQRAGQVSMLEATVVE